MEVFETVKVFDLSNAPAELRESEEMAILRPMPDDDEALILSLRVGEFETEQDGPINDRITRAVTFTEYQLHRWLTEQGAALGENVLLCWKPSFSAH